MAVLQIDNLSKSFGSVQAVRSLSLTVEEGEVFGLLGHNGAGKTTTIECSLGIKRYDSGDVTLLGMNPLEQRRELFTRVGVQFQEASYQDHIRVDELCDLFATLYEHPLDYRRLLDDFSLGEKKRAFVSSLSGGQRQKLTVVLALIPDPDVLFLDELTTGLDPQARREMWKYIRLLQKQGKTIFLTTHYMEEAEVLCDRIGLMRRGELVALGTPRELIDSCHLDYLVTIESPQREWEFLNGLDVVRSASLLPKGVLVRTGAGNSLLPLIRALDERGITIDGLHMRAPNLDDAYLHMTGVHIEEESGEERP